MLCDVCQIALAGIWDPQKTERIEERSDESASSEQTDTEFSGDSENISDDHDRTENSGKSGESGGSQSCDDVKFQYGSIDNPFGSGLARGPGDYDSDVASRSDVSDGWDGTFSKQSSQRLEIFRYRYGHHRDLMSLKSSVVQGCHICETLIDLGFGDLLRGKHEGFVTYFEFGNGRIAFWAAFKGSDFGWKYDLVPLNGKHS